MTSSSGAARGRFKPTSSTLAVAAVAALTGLGLGIAGTLLMRPPAVVPPPQVQPSQVQPPRGDAAPAVRYKPVAFADLPGWTEDQVSAALPALNRACRIFDGRADDAPVGPGGLAGTAGDWRAPCAALALVQPGDDDGLRAVLTNLFTPFAVETGDGTPGTFTGYYEASLTGSLTKTDVYNVPLYALPEDVVEVNLRLFDPAIEARPIVGRVEARRLVPYDTRADIESSPVFADRAEVLVWVDDPVDAHILHIQGSGTVRLTDGTLRRIGYAGNNGHRFRGIGGILLSAGELGPGQGSMPAVADWLRANPDAARRYMEQNPRFIFFRWIEGDGPIGALGAALVTGRSLAVDPAFMPLGAPLWLDSVDPDGEPLERLMVAMDTGAAIRGAVRGDFFWGGGEAAFAKAGRMKSEGTYYLLLPQSLSEGTPGAP